jgi:hypothetical protein
MTTAKHEKNHGSTRHNLGPGTAVTTVQRCTEYFEGFLLLLLMMWVLHDIATFIATFERELLEAHGTTRCCKKPGLSALRRNHFAASSRSSATLTPRLHWEALGGTGRQAETNDSWISYDFI